MKYISFSLVFFLLHGCKPAFKERIVWECEISDNGGTVDIPGNVEIPEDVGFVLVSNSGYSSWNEAINANEKLQISVEMVESEEIATKYFLSISIHSSENCRLVKSLREDGRIDIGWRFVNKSMHLQRLKLKIIDKDKIIAPSTKIRLIDYH